MFEEEMNLARIDQLQNDGYLLYYKSGMFRDKWCQVYYKLNPDCVFEWFNDKKSKTPIASVNLKFGAPDICIGPQTRLIPYKKPKLEKGWNQNQLIGMVKEKKVHYFYFKTIDIMKQWLSKVINKFPSNDKETYTSSPYFSKNGKEIRVDHNITTIYNSLDNYLGLYGFGWHFWLCSNENAPVYGDLMHCHESNHSIQHDETNNHHSHNIEDIKINHPDNSNNNDCQVTTHVSNHHSTHNHGDFGCYNHSSHANGTSNNYNDFSSHEISSNSQGFSGGYDSGAVSAGFSSSDFGGGGGGFSSSDCGGGGGF